MLILLPYVGGHKGRHVVLKKLQKRTRNLVLKYS